MDQCTPSYFSYHQTRLPLVLGNQSTSSFSSTLPSKARQHESLSSYKRSSRQASNLSSTQAALLPLERFSSSQKIRGKQVHNKSLAPQQIHLSPKIPHVKPCDTGFHVEPPGLDSINRPTGCLFSHPYTTLPSQIPGFYVPKSFVLFQSPAFRLERGTLHFHKGPPLPPQHLAPTRHTSHRLSRRLDHMGTVPGTYLSCIQHHTTVPSEIRILNQSKKISAHSAYRRRMARSSLAESRRQVGHSPRKTNSPQNSNTKLLSQTHLLTQRMGKSPRGSKLRDSDSNSQSLLATALDEASNDKLHVRERRPSTSPITSQKSPITLDGTSATFSDGGLPHRSKSCPPMDRCLNHWVGRAHRGPFNFRALVSTGKIFTHKHTGSPSSTILSPSSQLDRPTNTSLYRQRSGSIRDRQTLSKISHSQTRDCQAHSSLRQTNHKDKNLQNFNPPQLQSRQSQQIIKTSERMGATAEVFCRAISQERSIGNRFDGHEHESQTTRLSFTPPGSSSVGVQCSVMGLEQMETDLYFSSQVANPSGDDQTSILPVPRTNHPSLVPGGTMVPVHQEQIPVLVAPAPDGSNERWTARLREVDRIHFLRETFAAVLGNTVAARLVEGYRESTCRQAESAWKAFQRWLPQEVISITPKVIMEFLIYLEDEKRLEPRTILNYRSQLRLPFQNAFNLDLSSGNFSLLARSQFLRNPPERQKVPQWSLDKVLQTFSTPSFNLTTASPTNLLMKTLFLTALASGNRASELAATIRQGLSLTNRAARLPTKPGFLFKNQNLKNPLPPEIIFPALDQTHTLCPVAALRVYKTKTDALPHTGLLFVNPSSGKPLQAGRLSYWLAKAIKMGDPAASNPGGHDVRKFSHSVAHFRKVDPQEILRNGFWHSPNVFIDKYLVNCTPSNELFVAGRSK